MGLAIPGDPSTGIILSISINDKGSMLVILVIAMTLIAVLGASFVSIVGSKQEGVTYVLKGQQAKMIAKAGVEWAIRYVSDGLSDTSSTYYTSLPTQPATNKSFGDGSFSVTRNYNLSNISSDYIDVTSSFQGVSETIRLSRFRRYLNPLTLSPSQAPYRSGYYVYVPLAGNHSSGSSVSQLDLTVSNSGGYLYRIWLNNSSTGGWSVIFYFNSSTFSPCSASSPPCLDNTGFTQGIRLPSGVPVVLDSSKGLVTRNVVPDEVNTYVLEFYSSSTTPSGQYTFKPYTSPVPSELKFTP